MVKSQAYQKQIKFGGETWEVNHYESLHGPGLNLWDSANVRKANQELTFQIDSINKNAVCSEIRSLKQDFGYGVYEIQLTGIIDSIKQNTVFGLFLYQKESDNPLGVDIEFTKWDQKDNNNVHFSIHNLRDKGSQTISTNLTPGINQSTHVIKWTPSNILLGSFDGHIEYTEKLDDQLTKMDYDSSIEPEDLRFHINYWKFGKSERKDESRDITVNKFRYTSIK